MVCKDVSPTPDSNEKLRADINVCTFWQKKIFLSLCFRFFEPIASENDQDNGKPEKEKMYSKVTNQFFDVFPPRTFLFQPITFHQWNWLEQEKQFYRRLSQLLCEKSGVGNRDTSAWV